MAYSRIGMRLPKHLGFPRWYNGKKRNTVAAASNVDSRARDSSDSKPLTNLIGTGRRDAIVSRSRRRGAGPARCTYASVVVMQLLALARLEISDLRNQLVELKNRARSYLNQKTAFEELVIKSG